MTFVRTIGISLFFCVSITGFGSFSCKADGLQQLQQALKQLDNRQQISVMMNTQYKELRGKDKDKKNYDGSVDIEISESNQGLQLTYSFDVLQQLEVESQKLLQDEESNTPTLNAVNRISTKEITEMLSAASTLSRRIQQAKFLRETKVKYQGQQLRELYFQLPLEALIRDKKTRGYVKKFNSSFSVIIDDKGTPLVSKLSYRGKGSAYIIFSMKAYGETTTEYQVTNGRLLVKQQNYKSGYKSTFNDGETQEQVSLTPIKNTQLAQSNLSH